LNEAVGGWKPEVRGGKLEVRGHGRFEDRGRRLPDVGGWKQEVRSRRKFEDGGDFDAASGLQPQTLSRRGSLRVEVGG